MTTERFKYGRTFHLDFSEGLQNDDKRLDDLSLLEGQEVVALVKVDGENTTFYHDDYMHARSIDSATNWTRTHAQKIHSVIRHDIPPGYRLCCENMYAKHSIYYPDNYLEGYVYLLSVWNEQNECLSWDETKLYAELLDLPLPPELYRGVFDIKALTQLSKTLDTDIIEGFVVRRANQFSYADFSRSVAKWVRASHVQPNADFWLKTAVPNGLPRQPCKPAFMSQTRPTKPKV